MNTKVDSNTMASKKEASWIYACKLSDLPTDGGACLWIKQEQIAIFNFSRRNQLFATQNLCPHKQQMVLSRGMIGSALGEPKVACPFHKKTFSLLTGACLSGDNYQIKTYPVKVMGDEVYIGEIA